MDDQNQSVIGNTVSIQFLSLGDNEIQAKVDTGATNSSLHATNIKVNGNSVSFISPCFGNNSITLDLEGSQEVVSADAGGQDRPIIRLDINVNGKRLSDVLFNLNDRSEMDNPILIGQNILKAGNFIIDVNKDEESSNINESEEKSENKKDKERTNEIVKAISILKKYNVTIFELVEYLRTAPLYLRNSKEDEDTE